MLYAIDALVRVFEQFFFGAARGCKRASNDARNP